MQIVFSKGKKFRDTSCSSCTSCNATRGPPPALFLTLSNLIASTNDNDNDNDTAKFPHELDVDGCIVRPTNCNSSKEVLYITSILQNCQQSNQRVLKVRSQGLSQGPSPQGNPGNVYAIKNYQIISCTVTKSQSKRRCSL